MNPLLIPTWIEIGVLVVLWAAFLVFAGRTRRGANPRPQSLLEGLGVRTPGTLASDEAWTRSQRSVVGLAVVGAWFGFAGAFATIVLLFTAGADAAFVVGLACGVAEIGLAVVMTLRASAAARHA